MLIRLPLLLAMVTLYLATSIYAYNTGHFHGQEHNAAKMLVKISEAQKNPYRFLRCLDGEAINE